MVITALAGAARGAAVDIWTLYAAAIATGFGVAIMQPGLPTLVREWMPARIAIGTVAYTSGMLMGATFAPVLTIPLCAAARRQQLAARSLGLGRACAAHRAGVLSAQPDDTHERPRARTAIGGRWWPNWKDPLIWLLGLTFGSNNSTYFATNAFLGDYLASLASRSCWARLWAGSTARRSSPSSSLFAGRIGCSGARGRFCCSARCCSPHSSE